MQTNSTTNSSQNNGPGQSFSNATLGNLNPILINLPPQQVDTQKQSFLEKNAGAVLITSIVAIGGLFFSLYSYQVDKAEARFENDVKKLKVEYQGKLDWYTKRNAENKKDESKRCEYEKSKIQDQVNSCKNEVLKLTERKRINTRLH